MKNAFIQFKNHWKINLLVFAISLVLGGIIFVLFFFLRNRSFMDAVNGVSLAALFVLLSGLLALLAFLGAFDTFAFGFKQLGSMMFAKNARRDGTYADYRDKKREKRTSSSHSYLAIIAAGLIILIAAIILEIIYHSKF